MPRQNVNLEVKIGKGKCRVRKRGCCSSSSSSNYRLKRAIWLGRKLGSTTPVPLWKMMRSSSSTSVSARKLAANLWDIEGQIPRNEMAFSFSDLLNSPVSERRMDPSKDRRKPSTGSLKLLQTDYEVDQEQNHIFGHKMGSKNRLKNAYNSLITSKELLKVMRRVCCFDQKNETVSSLFAALKFELDQTYIFVSSLLHDQKANNQSETDLAYSQLKQQDKIRVELETEKKLRRQSERLNAKLGEELADTKACLAKTIKELDDEKRAREMLEQMCDEFARGINEDRAEVEKSKKKSEKVREELEKEREMLHLADVLREERVRMKMLEAKYLFEEKNAAMDDLRNEFEACLRSKKEKERRGNCSPRYEKIMELEKYLRETLPRFHHSKCDEDDSDLHSIELNADDLNRNFQWIENEPDSASRKTEKPFIPLAGKKKKKPENDVGVDDDDDDNYFGKKDAEEMERYKMIKDLRDHIVSGARKPAAQDEDHLAGSAKT